MNTLPKELENIILDYKNQMEEVELISSMINNFIIQNDYIPWKNLFLRIFNENMDNIILQFRDNFKQIEGKIINRNIEVAEITSEYMDYFFIRFNIKESNNYSSCSLLIDISI